MPFELKTSSGIVYLEWNNWAMHRFTELNSVENDANGKPIPIPATKMWQIYDSERLTFKHVITMIQAASDGAGKVIDEREASRLIDEGGGFQNPDTQILHFIRYTMECATPKLPEEKNEPEEKKS
jgi:hypothetical protein